MNIDQAGGVLLAPGMDRILDTLSKRQRRLVLLGLRSGEITSLSDGIVRGRGETETVQLELVHNHLPKLEEAGYIEWDQDTGEISRGPRFHEIEPLLELLENHADELPPDWP